MERRDLDIFVGVVGVRGEGENSNSSVGGVDDEVAVGPESRERELASTSGRREWEAGSGKGGIATRRPNRSNSIVRTAEFEILILSTTWDQARETTIRFSVVN